MLFHQPLARTAELQPGAVHQQIDGPGIAIGRSRPQHHQRRSTTSQRCVIRHAQRQTEQADNRADQSLSLPIGEAEHGAQRQRS